MRKKNSKLHEYLVCSNSYWPIEYFSVESDIILGENASNSYLEKVIDFVREVTGRK